MKARNFFGLVLIFFAMLFFSACSSKVLKKDDNSINVGVILPLSGPFSVFGKRILKGVELYVEKVNAKGGVGGKKINLFVCDNKSRAETTVEAYFDLVTKKGAVVVIGPYATTNTFAIKRDAIRFRVPVVTPGATNDQITERNPYLFRSCFTDSSQGKALAKFAYNNKKQKKVAVLVDLDEDGDYSKGLGRSFTLAFEKLGGKVVLNSGYHRDKNEFSELVKKSIKSGADSIFVPGYPQQAEAVIKAAASGGFKGRIFGGDGWDAPEILTESGPNAEGCFFSAMFYPDMKKKNVKEFVKLYEKTEKTLPGSSAAQGYDTAGMIVKSMQNGFTSENIRKGLQGIKNYEGVTGKITMTKDGNVKKDVYIKGIYKVNKGGLNEKLLGVISN